MVEGIVDSKFVTFKAAITLELLPIRISLQSHEQQMAEVRVATTTLAAAQARESGVFAAYRHDQRNNHEINTAKADKMLEMLSQHLGMHDGKDAAEGEHVETTERKKHTFREWIKVFFALISLEAIGHTLKEWWTRHHPPH